MGWRTSAGLLRLGAVAVVGTALAFGGLVTPSEPASAGARPSSATATAAEGARPSAAIVFADTTTNPFRADIDWVADQEITTGWRVGSSWQYRPFEPVRRDQLAAFLYRMDGRLGIIHTSTPFVDVPMSQPFATEITYVWRTGYATGWRDGTIRTYRPLQVVTRGELAEMLGRMETVPPPPARSPFVDVKPGDPFYAAICHLASLGILRGWPVPGGVAFRPNEAVRRDTMAVFLHRFLTRYPDLSAPRTLRGMWVAMDLVVDLNRRRTAYSLEPLVMTDSGRWIEQELANRMAREQVSLSSGVAAAEFASHDDLSGSPDGNSIQSASSLLDRWVRDDAKVNVLGATWAPMIAPGVGRDALGAWWSSVGLFHDDPVLPGTIASTRSATQTAEAARLATLRQRALSR